MEKSEKTAEKTFRAHGDDWTRLMLGMPGPVSYDLLRTWIADRYHAETFEIVHELGLEPEPTWFSNEDRPDYNVAEELEKQDRWREWKKVYDQTVQEDPERYRLAVAKIGLRYADGFLRLAGIKRQEAVNDRPPSDA